MRTRAMWALLLVPVAAGAVYAADLLTVTSQAAGKYQARDYAGAAALYEKVITSGHSSAALYYDLGNAYFKAGSKARALLNWRRAERLAPRDPDIRWNIDIARQTLTDRISPADATVLSVKLSEWAGAVSMQEVSWALLGTFILLALSAALAALAPAAAALARAGTLAALLGLAAVSVVFWLKWTEVKDPAAVVMVKEVAAHYGPSETETKAFVLHEGAELRVIDETADWYFIELANKNTGWVSKASCELI